MRVPETIQVAISELTGIGVFVAAKEWERAAYVYAFTRDGDGEYHGNQYEVRSRTATQLTPREFAALGINGLKSDTTVRIYREAWKLAIEAGAKAVGPGDEFEPPDLDWPPTHRGGANSAGQVSANASSLGTALQMAPPEVLAKAVESLPPETRVEVARTALNAPEVRGHLQDNPEAHLDLAHAVDDAFPDEIKNRPPVRRDVNWTPEREIMKVLAGALWLWKETPDMGLSEERKAALIKSAQSAIDCLSDFQAIMRGENPDAATADSVEDFLASVRAKVEGSNGA